MPSKNTIKINLNTIKKLLSKIGSKQVKQVAPLKNRYLAQGPVKALGGEGTAIGVPANDYTLYIYFTNDNRSVKADFS